MHKICRQCQTNFEITDEDLAFLDKVSPIFNGRKQSIPPPTLCPHCRLQRRLAFRNQIYVHVRPSASGKPLFTKWTDDVPFPVLPNQEWYGDSWDPLSYGRDVDFSRPFFDQLKELRNQVPHKAIETLPEMINSDYCTNATGLKNCYLVFNASWAEDCMYCENAWRAKDCVDCTRIPDAELCYDCTACPRCYNLQSSDFCENCSDSFFLSHCRGCHHCFGCVNLRHQEYCIFNEQKTKEEYETFIREFRGSSYRVREEMREKFHALTLTQPRSHAVLLHTEDVTGNHIAHAKSVHDSFFIDDGENVRYCFSLDNRAKDCYDHTLFGDNVELTYEVAMGGSNAFHLCFCCLSLDNAAELLYCWICVQSKNCFGCACLKRKEYCILNKQYTKEGYEALVPKIIGHMRSTGEWGEFFPLTFSAIPYNQSLAQRYFPLGREEVHQKGLLWFEKETEDAGSAIDPSILPDDLPENNDPIIVRSLFSGRPFKITPQEIKRYREFKVPLPRMTYDERMEERAKKLGGIKLYERTCVKTGKLILTTYPPDSPYIIWDREVYEQEFGG